MGQQVRFRKQASLSITGASQRLVQQLGKGMVYRELVLRFSGSFTQVLGNNTNAGWGRGDEWSAIQRIDIVANGSDTIRSFSGTELKMMNRLMYGQTARPSPRIGDGVADPTFDSNLIIPFWMFQAARPMDTAFDSSTVTDFRIEVQINAFANMAAGAPTGINATLEIGSLESFGLEAKFSDCRVFKIQSVLAGANPAFQVPLPVTALYRGVFVNIADGATEIATDQAGSLSNIKVLSGTTVFRDIPAKMLRDWQRQRVGFGRDIEQRTANARQPGSTDSFANVGQSNRLDEDAWYWLDFVQDGFLMEGIDTVGFSELILEFNSSGGAGTTITVLPVQVFPVRNAK